MRHSQPQWLVRITAESGSLTLALVSRPRHQPPVVIQLYSVYGLISNTMFAQSKEMNQAVDIYTALSIHTERCRYLYAQCLHSSGLAADIYPALGVDIYKHTSSSSDPVPGAPPHPATRCRYLHTRYLHSVDIPSDPTLLLFPGMCPGCRVSELSPDLGYREPGARCQQQPHSHTGR